MKHLYLGVIAPILVASCVYSGPKLNEAIRTADAACDQKFTGDFSKQVACYNDEERDAWRFHAGKYYSYYQRVADYRSSLAAQVVAGQLSYADARAKFSAFVGGVYAQVNQLTQADDAATAQARANVGDALTALGNAALVLGAAQNQYQAQQPTTIYVQPAPTTTTCQRVGVQLQCTTQ